MGRHNSDEAYVVALCDLVLDEIGLPQYRFDWLRGDPNSAGRQVKLPVDGYWPKANVVLVYREVQHSRPVPHFDKPERLTVSGVHRGLQRAIYDARREELIPYHGIRLVIISPENLSSDLIRVGDFGGGKTRTCARSANFHAQLPSTSPVIYGGSGRCHYHDAA